MESKPWKLQADQGNRTGDQRTDQEEEEEQDIDQEPNPLAIVPSTADPTPLAEHHEPPAPAARGTGDVQEVVSAQRVRREEVESKISAWETEELAKIDSRFRRQEAIISGWEAEQIEQASAWLKKIEVCMHACMHDLFLYLPFFLFFPPFPHLIYVIVMNLFRLIYHDFLCL